MLISQLIGKKVLTLNAESMGEIVGFTFNTTFTAVNTIITDKYHIPASNVFSIADAVTVNYDNSTSPSGGIAFPPAEVYTTAGKLVGIADDCEITKSLAVKRVFCGERKITPASIYRAEKVILLKGALPLTGVAATRVNSVAHNVNRYEGNLNLLIGKRVTSSVYDRNGKLIISKDGKITADVLRKTARCGKLRELAYKCR